MQVKIKQNIEWQFRRPNSVKFYEKTNGEWVDVDTTHLYDDQYDVIHAGNTYRIMDYQIDAVRDDARVGMGRCMYCGKLVKFGEAEKHFSERERNCCKFDKDKHITQVNDAACPYIQTERVNEQTSKNEEEGYHYSRNIITTTWDDEYNVCVHKANPTVFGRYCQHQLCRVYGIKWFMPENTFFLRYPNGAPKQIPIVNKNGEKNVVQFDSYYLSYDETDNFYTIHNTRKKVKFLRNNGQFDDYKILAYNSTSDRLSDIPPRIMKRVTKFFEELEASNH